MQIPLSGVTVTVEKRSKMPQMVNLSRVSPGGAAIHCVLPGGKTHDCSLPLSQTQLGELKRFLRSKIGTNIEAGWENFVSQLQRFIEDN
jgi:hypothetical protein